MLESESELRPSWILPDGVFTKGRIEGSRVVEIHNGVIRSVRSIEETPASVRIDRRSGILSPRPIDLQVNGGGGTLFNTSPSVQGIASIVDAHRTLGTGSIMPTLISDEAHVMNRATEAILEAWGMEGLFGVHLEGPHISKKKRGTHSAGVLRPIDHHTFKNVGLLRQADIPTMVTLAPEIVDIQDIQRLVDLGVVVSLGHSNAEAGTVRKALKAGATCFTHLYNAMSPFQGREPGMVGAALGSSALAGVICDGHHVSFETLAIVLPGLMAEQRAFFVSDAMPTVGGPEEFELYGSPIKVQQGRLVNAEGSLAGAHITMKQSMQLAATELSIDPELILQMAVSVPAKVMGLDHLADVRGMATNKLCLWSKDFRSSESVSTPEGIQKAAHECVDL